MIIANFLTLQKRLQISKRQFVARLILSVIFMLLLYGVIGQMSVNIIWIVVKLLAAGSKVTFFVPIGLYIAIVRGHQGIAADVEFSVLVEQRVDVLLNEGAFAESAQLSHCLKDVVSALLNADACSSVCVLAWFHDPNGLFFTQILRKLALILINVICFGNDFMLVYLLSFAVLLDILEQTFLVGYFIVIFQVIMHPQFIDDDFFDSLRLGHENFLSPAIRLRLGFVSIQQSPFLRLLFRFHKDRSQVGLLPITKLRPYYVCILLAVDNLQVDSPSHEFIDKSRIVALINEHFHLLLPLEVDSSDSIVAQDLFKENLLMRLLFFRSRLLYCLSLLYLILMGLFLPRHPSEKLGANEVKRGIGVRQRSFKVSFVLDDIVDGVYFGQLQKGFLLSEVGERVLAQYGTLERRVASYRIILVMDGFKVLLAFGTSLLHQQKTFIEFEIQRYLQAFGETVGVGECNGTQGIQSGSKREGRKGGID